MESAVGGTAGAVPGCCFPFTRGLIYWFLAELLPPLCPCRLPLRHRVPSAAAAVGEQAGGTSSEQDQDKWKTRMLGEIFSKPFRARQRLYLFYLL